MKCITKSELEIIKKFRLLWNQHSEWTRMAINAIILGLPNQEQTVNRLLQNPDDFGRALSVFYGERSGNRFSILLHEHLVLAADLIQAILAGNTHEADDINTRWYANAEEIAIFLGRLNPCWSEKEWREMFFAHLQLVTDQIFTLINKEYQRNIDLYDVLEFQAMEMADIMSGGIIDQFLRRECRRH